MDAADALGGDRAWGASGSRCLCFPFTTRPVASPQTRRRKNQISIVGLRTRSSCRQDDRRERGKRQAMTIPRFDGAAAWAALSADAQAHIGTLAIELIVANETACAVADLPGNTHPDPVRFRAACVPARCSSPNSRRRCAPRFPTSTIRSRPLSRISAPPVAAALTTPAIASCQPNGCHHDQSQRTE